MTVGAIDYWKLRDELAEKLNGIAGVVSVGIGKVEDRTALIVLVDRAKFDQYVGSYFEGIPVRVQELGSGVAHID
jgi:hypothetical protein